MALGIFQIVTRVSLASYKEPVRITVFLWLLLSVGLIYKFAPEVYMLKLGDNDNFMRYVQFTEWLKQGNWYLEPLPRFNPQDGVIIHWSRLPDILLALVTVISSWAMTDQIAETVAMSVVPCLYFLLLLLATGAFTYRTLGRKYTIISVVFIAASSVIAKFMPGSIDHHNIQLVLAAWFLTLTPFRHYECKKHTAAVLQGVLLGLSFWVGLENIIFFAAVMVLITLLGYIQSVRFLYYARLVCISAVITCVILLPVNRPLSEFFTGRVDALSLPYVFALSCGYLFCQLSLFARKTLPTNRYLTYLVLGVLSLMPVAILTPEILLGVYYHYPPLLDKYWLSQVIEARSSISYILSDGFFASRNLILPLLPAFFSVIYIRTDKVSRYLYALFILLALPFIFWQIRTVYIAFVVGMPLQALFAVRLAEQMKVTLLKAATIIFCIPACLMLLASLLHSATTAGSGDELAKASGLDKADIISVLLRHQVTASRILAPFDYGAAILAETDNQVISAPYHRNIQGNQLTVELFTTTNLDLVRQKLKTRHIDYVMFGPHSTSKIFSVYSDKSSFINQLYAGQYPSWLRLVEKNEQGFLLFKVKTQ
ncbi:hypothetical protein DI392_05965 [Vibrio albus]|uniref:Glycosyltransferase RgtA/B/C/D-like domain-containing protein n=1 Tax=Vibrio albus TaxID=2200953 RepID=A0A2U3BCW7_9VIBR|nr:hypothetical protein [Vibrio albus]PWI34646.1 hypothetical protein DI392_05965 [Vibrio albus]